MDYRIMQMSAFTVIGFQKVLDNETSYSEILEYWSEVIKRKNVNSFEENNQMNTIKQALNESCIGEYGISIDDIGDGKFRYLIAGVFNGGKIPDGMVIFEVPENMWAVFKSVGKFPETLQFMNVRVFRDWLPGNPVYELSGNICIERLSPINKNNNENYLCELWIPIIKRP